MSCGGGCGGKVPTMVQLRQFAVNVVAGDVAKARTIMAFLLEGIDASMMSATGGEKTPESRNTVLNQPVRAPVANGVLAGAIAQMSYEDCLRRFGGEATRAMDKALSDAGLRFGMTTDDLREWIAQGG